MGHVKQEKSTSSNNNTTAEPPSFIEFISLKDQPRPKKKSSNATEESQFERARDRLNCDEPNRIGFEKYQHNSRENQQYPKQLNAEELISQINCNQNGSHNNNSVVHHNNTSNNLQNEVRNNNNNNNNDSNNNNSHSNNRSSCNQQQQQQHQQRSQPQGAESVEADDVEKGSDDQSLRNRRQKPLFRRLYSFFRNLWIGATFHVGKAGKQSNFYSYLDKFIDCDFFFSIKKKWLLCLDF